MKVLTALITINDETKLKVVLIPETESERQFLTEALDKADGYDLSAEFPDQIDQG